MGTNRRNSPRNLKISIAENKHFISNFKIVFASFFKAPKTVLQVSSETNVCKNEIRNYLKFWKRRSCISEIKQGQCPISKRKGVNFYSTNPNEWEFNSAKK